MPYAQTRDARIHWEETGSGEPLLLVMGFGLSGDAWAPLLPLLSGHRVIWYDNRGTGTSEGPMGDLTIATLADDAAAVLQEAGVERAHVHGQSMGGMIAQQLTLDHPEMVHSLALGATTPSPVRFFPDDPQGVVDLYTGIELLSSDPDRAIDLLLPAVFSPEYLRDNPSIRELYAQLAGGGAPSPEATQATIRAIADMSSGRAFDVVDRLGEISLPTLVQHGSADRIIPVAAGRYLGEHIAGAEYHELPGAGHVYAMEQPMEALQRLLGFWTAHPLGAAV
ncbi:MAG TPA: alpha/beta fold hydrolase [Candidatus Dormibacteraeota bacterium]|jgi:pimeloyl-ACP methyl ester carboxylesterase|nr:alpha/beta fold hydrolase [Candidatus Dormibacteraeota bacterium]